MKNIAIIGAGLAGCDCAWLLAEHFKRPVHLYEMKPTRMSPAHHIKEGLGELVCSNSLKSTSLLHPVGLLKQEIKQLGSLLISKAYEHRVPAGETLAIERHQMSIDIKKTLQEHPLIHIHEEYIDSLKNIIELYDIVVIATGPLTEGNILQELIPESQNSLYFYDAIAPIIETSSINMEKAFWQNRRTRTQDYSEKNNLENLGTSDTEDDYLNIPLNKEEYMLFVEELQKAQRAPLHDFEKMELFSGCQPIEALADTGIKTLSFGPMKGKGLVDPRTDRFPYAAIQLRQEDPQGEYVNMVGFQTRLTWPEQKRVFSLLPALENATFVRYGSMHRNTYIQSPLLLDSFLKLKSHPFENKLIYISGQLTGVEGYVESAAMGCWCALAIHFSLQEKDLPLPPLQTALGTLLQYLRTPQKKFSPTNTHWGLFPPLTQEDLHETPLPRKDKTLKRHFLSTRALVKFESWKASVLY